MACMCARRSHHQLGHRGSRVSRLKKSKPSQSFYIHSQDAHRAFPRLPSGFEQLPTLFPPSLLYTRMMCQRRARDTLHSPPRHVASGCSPAWTGAWCFCRASACMKHFSRLCSSACATTDPAHFVPPCSLNPIQPNNPAQLRDLAVCDSMYWVCQEAVG